MAIRALTWYGSSCSIRSSHASTGSPIDTQISVWMKSTPFTDDFFNTDTRGTLLEDEGAVVDFQIGQVGAGVGDLRVEALDLGVQRIDLLALALQVGLGLGHLRAGNMAVGGEGGDPLLRDVPGLAQGLCAGQVDLRAAQAGLARLYLGFTGGDQAGLLGQFAHGLQALGFASGQHGIGAVDGEVEVIAFEAAQSVRIWSSCSRRIATSVTCRCVAVR